jgi:hypothetical protein
MAPEAILEAKFSSAGDVWSFGVLGWEMTSYAMTPYGTLSGPELLEDIRRGHRLPQPPGCPDPLYALLKLCWSWDSQARPVFAELESGLNILRSSMPRTAAASVFTSEPVTLLEESLL